MFNFHFLFIVLKYRLYLKLPKEKHFVLLDEFDPVNIPKDYFFHAS